LDDAVAKAATGNGNVEITAKRVTVNGPVGATFDFHPHQDGWDLMAKNLFGGRRLLVVEDDYLIVAEMVRDLQSSGAEVIGPIPSLEQALERLEAVPGIEGALLDINLRGEMVFPLADELRRRGIPFVFATGYDDLIIPLQYRSVRRFSKPVYVEEIAAALGYAA
jgi:CheY-like chemotaxis protein